MRILLVFLCLTLTSCEERRIAFLAMIFRHGDRTPVAPYPTDPWRKETIWPVKFGQLTNIGKTQHYNFGKAMRTRYSNFVSVNYNPDEIYVRSTDVDRTLMSAQAFLAGMYPPRGSAVWLNTLIWQPIPVHTVHEDADEILAMKKKCPAYEVELSNLRNSADYKANLYKFHGVLTLLTAFTGINISDYEGISQIYDTLLIEKLYNLQLPAWTSTVFPDTMRKPACYSFRVPTMTPTLARLKVGPLISQITQHMLDVTRKSGLKMSIYSAHDITVASILNAMGMFDGKCPVYTSAVFFELSQIDVNSTFYLRILYRNTTGDEEPTVLNIPGCGQECKLEQFIDLYSNLLIKDWERECNATNYGLLMFFLIVCVFGICFSIIKFFAYLSSNNEQRSISVVEYHNDGTNTVTFLDMHD